MLLLNKNTRATGKRYEEIALSYLQSSGLKYTAKNIYTPFGEIDLLMQDKQTLVFVEVRYRRTDNYGDAIASVTKCKQQRLLNAARYWLMHQGLSFENIDCRFDVLAITGHHTEWITPAFNESSV